MPILLHCCAKAPISAATARSYGTNGQRLGVQRLPCGIGPAGGVGEREDREADAEGKGEEDERGGGKDVHDRNSARGFFGRGGKRLGPELGLSPMFSRRSSRRG